LNLESEQQMN